MRHDVEHVVSKSLTKLNQGLLGLQKIVDLSFVEAVDAVGKFGELAVRKLEDFNHVGRKPHRAHLVDKGRAVGGLHTVAKLG